MSLKAHDKQQALAVLNRAVLAVEKAQHHPAVLRCEAAGLIDHASINEGKERIARAMRALEG